jgi:hypothetical protein
MTTLLKAVGVRAIGRVVVVERRRYGTESDPPPGTGNST